MAGDRLLRGEPVDLGLPEVAVERAQRLLVGVGEGRRTEQPAVGQGDDPLDLDLDANWEVLAEAIQTVVRAEIVAGRSAITDPYYAGPGMFDDVLAMNESASGARSSGSSNPRSARTSDD